MRRKLAAIVAGAMMVGVANAEDIKMSPNFDISYMHSDAKSSGLNQGQAINEREDFDVQYAGIDFSGASKNVGWVLGVNFAGDASNAQFIDTAYLTYGINDNFSVMAGRFYTYIGENVLNKGNWNYTNSVGDIASGVNYHEGLGVSYDAKNGFAASLFYVDGMANSEDSFSGTNYNTSKKGLGVTASYAMDKWKAEVDYYSADDRDTMEATTFYGVNFNYAFNEKFSAAFAALMGSSEGVTVGKEQSFDSYAVYGKFMATEKFYVALRYELFSEEKDSNTANEFWYSTSTRFAGYTTLTDTENDINSATLTLGHDCGNGSEFKLEYRMDSSDKKIYTHSDGTLEDSNNTIALAWLFSY